MPQLQVALSPGSMPNVATDTIGVMVDVFRASSTILAALAAGAKAVLPVAAEEQWAQQASADCLLAGERNGLRMTAAVLDNSPLSFTPAICQTKTIALTTTNGTRALDAMVPCSTITIGSFNNVQVLSHYLRNCNRPVLIVCAGWHNAPAIEDTFFAGTLINQLLPAYTISNDGALTAQAVYHTFRGDPINYLRKGEHYQRLTDLGKTADIEYCLKKDIHPFVPILAQGAITQP